MSFVLLFIHRVFTILTVTFLAAVVILPALQIVLRLVGISFVGGDELTRFLLICLVFTGYPLVVLHRENVGMSELKDMLPSLPRMVVDALISLSSVFTAAFVAYATWETIFKNLKNSTPTLHIPFWIFLTSTLVAFAMAALLHLIQIGSPTQKKEM